MSSKVIAIIPARYQSSRFPGKPLVNLLQKPMIVWVLELASLVLDKKNLYVATDDHRIAEVVSRHGYQYVMTSSQHLTGTDRLAEVAEKINADIYLNIQGDEPTIHPLAIKKVLDAKRVYRDEVINAMSEIGSNEDPQNVNLPKVVFNKNLKLLYMSRLPVPGAKTSKLKPSKYYKQVCIYAFYREHLLTFGKTSQKGFAESCEDIEILRFLELDIPVRMVEVESCSYAVDVEADIPVVEKRLREIHGLTTAKTSKKR